MWTRWLMSRIFDWCTVIIRVFIFKNTIEYKQMLSCLLLLECFENVDIGHDGKWNIWLVYCNNTCVYFSKNTNQYKKLF